MSALDTISTAWKTVKKKMGEIFHSDELERMARKSKFIQRSSSHLQGKDFVNLMTAASIDSKSVSLEGLCHALREINPEVDLTPQALMERINNPNAAAFLKQVFESVLKQGLVGIVERVPSELLQSFKHVWIEDCSECVLNEALQEAFKGSGGVSSKACVKLDVVYEVKQQNIHIVDLVDRRSPDQKLAKKHLDMVQEGDLWIRDLGFFDEEVLKIIVENGAYFLSRLPACVDVYLNKTDQESIDLAGYINHYFPNASMIDIQVFITGKKLPCRLIAYRAPQEVANKRRREANKLARKRGYTPKTKRLNRLDFTLFVSNVSAAILPPEVIGTVYMVRWQIELIFKNWKSSLQINYLRGINANRIRCLLYGKLIVIIITNTIYKLAAWYAEQINREISLHKVVNWLKQNNKLRKIFLEGMKVEFMKLLIREIPKTLCKNKRNRKTTEASIKTSTAFPDLYKKNVEIQFAKVV
jgi:DDE family transposase